MVSPLSEFLEIRFDAAVAQWRRVRAREPKPRQERFLPIEVILSFGFFRLLNPHRFGGRNIADVPPAVTALARTLRRTPGSITSKMLNLDGSRPNAGRLEPELFIALSVSSNAFVALYRRVIEAAREAGFDEAAVPDFLGFFESRDARLFGQDEIGEEEIELALAEAHTLSTELRDEAGLTERETERIVEQRVRLGQHRFAREVLESFEHRCGFCGFSPRSLQGHRLLVASHIKPWRACGPRERLDPLNGVAACPTHDAAFDTGLLTVGRAMEIRRAPALLRSIDEDEGVERFLGDGGIAAHLIMPTGRKPPSTRYLDYHAKELFRA